MAISKKDTAERDQAIERLREIFPAGSTVTTLLRHVSQSGMSRAISIIASGEDGPEDVTYLVARATGDRMDQRHGGIKMSGCGVDMGFALVYSLARTLYGDAPDSGYVLNHRWI